MQTVIHAYSFDVRKPADKEAYEALRAKLKASGVRCMESWGGNGHYEFVRAIKSVDALYRSHIRMRAQEKYSMHYLKYDYQRYFDRLSLLWSDGWNSL